MKNFTPKLPQPKSPWTRVKGAKLLCNRPKKPKLISFRSKALARRMQSYNAIRTSFLSYHKQCEVVWFGQACKNPSEDIHHTHGRIGRLLCYIPWFLPVCRSCHSKIEVRKEDARKNGYLCEKGLWNKQPPQDVNEPKPPFHSGTS